MRVVRPATSALAVLVLACLGPGASPILGQEAPASLRAFTTEDALDVRYLSPEALTDDGRWLAAVVSTRRGRTEVDHERFGDPTYLAPAWGELVVVDSETGTLTSLFDRPVQVPEMAWSPDGDRLAFLLRDGTREAPGDGVEVHLWDRADGSMRPVPADVPTGISTSSALHWMPDGEHLVVELRPVGWAGEAREAFLDLTEGPVVVQDSRDDFLSWNRVRNLDTREIPVRLALADGSVQPLLPETPVEEIVVAEDGADVLVVEARPLRTDYEDFVANEYRVLRVPVEGGTPEVLLGPMQEEPDLVWSRTGDAFAWSDDGNVYLRRVDADDHENLTGRFRDGDRDDAGLEYQVVRWSPDGTRLLLESDDGWHLLQADGSELERVWAAPDDEDAARPTGFRRSVVGWDAGDGLLVESSARDRWHRGLQRYDLADRAFSDVVMDDGVYDDWLLSEDGAVALVLRSDGDRPEELWRVEVAGGTAPTRLTELNPQLDEVALARTELVEYLDVDGHTLHGILYHPPQDGGEGGEPEPRPLVTEVYEDFFDNGFNENMNLVTARGWVGFRPSVRFEEGYPGEAWLKAVPSAINELMDRGLVDGERLGVYGQSYGGYAVNLLITQTDRFAAAANVSGKVNIISFLGDSPRIGTRNYRAAEVGQDRIGASLWEQPHKYMATSAVLFADRIETPLLLLSGEDDWNVPTTNQREMYYALRRLGKPVVWVNYMDGGHGAGRAGSVEDFHDHWQRLLDWFDGYFDPESDGS